MGGSQDVAAMSTWDQNLPPPQGPDTGYEQTKASLGVLCARDMW